jgi:cell division septation protein DedD
MATRRTHNSLRILCALAVLFARTLAFASEYHGQVTFNALPVPGATVTAAQGDKKSATVTDMQGQYSFPDLADGNWTIQIEMTGFTTLNQSVTIAPSAPAANWELKLMTLDQIRAATKAVKVEIMPVAAPAPQVAQATTAKPQESAPTPEKPPDDVAQRAADGFLINGSVNNAATSQYALSQAFGNTRNGGKGLYTGGFSLVLNNSALDANQFSLTGQNTAKPSFNQATAGFQIGGPLKIPHLFPLYRAPYFTIGYQWTRNSYDTTVPALVPTNTGGVTGLGERGGDFSGTGVNIYNNQPFNASCGVPTGAQYSYKGNLNVIPPGCIASPQATPLLNFYPLPNVANNLSTYNYQAPILIATHQDSFQARLQKSIGNRNQVYGVFAFQSTRSGNPSIFNFVDTTDIFGLNSNINWTHTFNRQIYLNISYSYSRSRTLVRPNFAGGKNISGLAGITGNDQIPADKDFGPPALNFSSGIYTLSDAVSEYNRNQTGLLSGSLSWYRSRHNIVVGGDYRRREFNYLQQQNPRGAFTFTGAATASATAGTGVDFADFLTGVPDTSNIAYGNADKYFRQSVYDAYINDDWRVRPDLTLKLGLRWEYGAPITELLGRLVNLDVASGFTAVAPVEGYNPIGSLTGQQYPTSLIQPDKHDIEPRIGLSWRPFSGSSVVVRAGYGIYADTSVYQSMAVAMAQQPPQLAASSNSLSVQNSSNCPLTLANGFPTNCSNTTQDTSGIDPNFRVGYAQAWQLQVQRDLPAALVLIATYSGIKGTRGVQEFLPNTNPICVTPCVPSTPTGPVGFTYITSTGDSTSDSGSVQLRRRLRSGFTASVTYTYSKSVDDDSSIGGQGPLAAGAVSQSSSNAVIAQNWQNLTAERGRSSFDQRNLLNSTIQYTTGMGLHGGSLLSGWRGMLYKEWTLQGIITVGSGLPETPIYFAAVPGTGVTGTIRAQVTGASIHAAPAGLFLNPAAYTTPPNGYWGNAGRDSITGPSQFSFNASMVRTFRIKTRYNFSFELDSANLLNHVTYSSWNTTVNSPQFGSAASANNMRTVLATMRLRF